MIPILKAGPRKYATCLCTNCGADYNGENSNKIKVLDVDWLMGSGAILALLALLGARKLVGASTWRPPTCECPDESRTEH
jgi:hypothetical protein